MSKFFYQLLFFFFVLLTGYACAGQNSFTTTYPAPQASYTKIVLANQSNAANICGITVNGNYINNGALFVDPLSGNLETCVNGSAVTSLQGCFNRFCSVKCQSSTGAGCTCAAPTLCSTLGAYTQPMSGGNRLQDFFLTGSDGINYYWTTSVVCCPSTAFNFPNPN